MSIGKSSTWVEEGARRTFQEETPGQLSGQDYSLVECGAADNTVKLNTTAGNEVGVMWEKLQPLTSDIDVAVRLFSKEGTVKVIQSGAIAYGSRVVCDPANPTQVMALPAAAGNYRVLGRKFGAGGGGAGDIIEISDCVETILIEAQA